MRTGTLILGGGFGGLATAHELRSLAGPDHAIVVVDRSPGFYVGLRKLWMLVGEATLEEGIRPRRRLQDHGIDFLEAEIVSIDADGRTVQTSAGPVQADFLVVALGAAPRADLVPGLAHAEAAYNLYDPHSVEAAARRVTSLREGRVVVTIAGLPYKCPPAPYEACMLLDAHFRARGVREAVSLTFTTLQPALLPNAGPEGARWLAEQFGRRDIEHRVDRTLRRVESDQLVFEEEELAYDLAVLVPPHLPPAVVRTSELPGTGGWVPVDRGTLQTSFPGVYAIGDVTHIPLEGGAALPKAGLFAEAEGKRVARAIAAELGRGGAPAPFDGLGSCWLETGDGEAALVRGDFFASGGPAVHVEEISRTHMEEKRRFEAERLDGWLGTASAAPSP